MRNPDQSGREVLIVGNYLPDGQESMLRFARMLREGLQARGTAAEIVTPGVWFGRRRRGMMGAGRWLAYLDKFVIFPWTLRRRVRRLGAGGVVHIADHSNAMYVPAAGSAGHRVVVTCHDLGAVRAALGEDTGCPVTRMGKVLQGWVARSLGKADEIACVSTATKRDVERLIRRRDGSRVPVALVLNGLNAPYGRLKDGEARAAAAAGEAGMDVDSPFTLNVGSSLGRKNRDGVLRIFARVQNEWPEGQLVFAGEELTLAERTLAAELGIGERVTAWVKPTDAVLEALYNRAVCLVFPSKFEGFGWPAVEAQACGCPVLCSDAGSLPEVVEESAFVRPFADEAAFAAEILRLVNDEPAREAWREKGERNVGRFRTETMIEKYERLYDELSDAAEKRDVPEVAVRG